MFFLLWMVYFLPPRVNIGKIVFFLSFIKQNRYIFYGMYFIKRLSVCDDLERIALQVTRIENFCQAKFCSWDFFIVFQYLKELLSDHRDLSTGMFVLSPWNIQTAELKNLLFQIRSRILTFFKNNVSVPGIILLYQYLFQEICWKV